MVLWWRQFVRIGVIFLLPLCLYIVKYTFFSNNQIKVWKKCKL